jgi:hypothetical protein
MLRAMEAKASATLNMQGFICLCFCNTFLKKYERKRLIIYCIPSMSLAESNDVDESIKSSKNKRVGHSKTIYPP